MSKRVIATQNSPVSLYSILSYQRYRSTPAMKFSKIVEPTCLFQLHHLKNSFEEPSTSTTPHPPPPPPPPSSVYSNPPCIRHSRVITQVADQVRMRLISHLIKCTLRVLQKLLKYFNGTTTSRSVVSPEAGVFHIFLTLNLNKKLPAKVLIVPRSYFQFLENFNVYFTLS